MASWAPELDLRLWNGCEAQVHSSPRSRGPHRTDPPLPELPPPHRARRGEEQEEREGARGAFTCSGVRSEGGVPTPGGQGRHQNPQDNRAPETDTIALAPSFAGPRRNRKPEAGPWLRDRVALGLGGALQLLGFNPPRPTVRATAQGPGAA
jgi:hypothetical protein